MREKLFVIQLNKDELEIILGALHVVKYQTIQVQPEAHENIKRLLNDLETNH